MIPKLLQLRIGGVFTVESVSGHYVPPSVKGGATDSWWEKEGNFP